MNFLEEASSVADVRASQICQKIAADGKVRHYCSQSQIPAYPVGG